MKILLACEESQAVCIELRKLGVKAFSCDIQACSGGHPEWHIQDDVFNVINSIHFDCMIAFPPCTDLAVSGAAHFYKKQVQQEKALEFVKKLMAAPIKHIAIENPVSVISTRIRKPDQIIQPYFFGDNVPKKTCLWLKNLPKLTYCLESNLFEEKTSVEPVFYYYNSKKTKSGKSKYSVLGAIGSGKGKERSKTFTGIAQAMANQWGQYLTQS